MVIGLLASLFGCSEDLAKYGEWQSFSLHRTSSVMTDAYHYTVRKAENGEMTASDLSRTTGIPVTTVLRHIEALTEDYLLSVSRRKGLQIFYMLNREYIDKARRKMDRYLTKLSGIE